MAVIKRSVLIPVVVAIVLFASCSKKKSKKTTPANKPAAAAAKQECKCPKFRLCASKERVARIKDRCTPWQKKHFGITSVHKKEYYIGQIRPLYVAKYLRDDGTLACRETDLNGDGLPDIFYFYDKAGVNILEIQQDFDYDGIIDQARLFRAGFIAEERYNTDGDESTWEVVKRYKQGLLVQIKAMVVNPFSKDHPTCPSYNYWENFDLKTLELTSISYDNDCDSRPDFIISTKGRSGHMTLTEQEKTTYKKMQEEEKKAQKKGSGAKEGKGKKEETKAGAGKGQ